MNGVVPPLLHGLSVRELQDLAGMDVYLRGRDYLVDGRVAGLTVEGGQATVAVHGTAAYDARLRVAEGALDFGCTCPMGVEDVVCKHVVAVGLAAIEGVTGAEASAHQLGAAHPQSRDAVEAWLAAQPHADLVALVLDQAAADEGPLEPARAARRIARDVAGPGGRTGEEHPEDAIGVWRRELDEALQRAHNSAYDQVVEILQTPAAAVRPCRAAQGLRHARGHDRRDLPPPSEPDQAASRCWVLTPRPSPAAAVAKR